MYQKTLVSRCFTQNRIQNCIKLAEIFRINNFEYIYRNTELRRNSDTLGIRKESDLNNQVTPY